MAKVIFTAVAKHGGVYGPFSSDTTLVFNTNITNVGGGYDNTSGNFTAPVAGFYYFTFYYHAREDRKSGLSLMKNGDLIVKAADDTQSGSNFVDNAGNAACLKLNAGDQVFVCLPGDCRIWAADNMTSFSGFLISEM